jgi:hypothetical protein
VYMLNIPCSWGSLEMSLVHSEGYFGICAHTVGNGQLELYGRVVTITASHARGSRFEFQSWRVESVFFPFGVRECQAASVRWVTSVEESKVIGPRFFFGRKHAGGR